MTALPFIMLDSSSGMYTIRPEATAFLSKIRGPLAVIAIAGKYRTGKSFLMNRVLFENGGNFHVGSSVNACTKGLWILDQLVSCELPDGQTVQALVIDTEGIGSLEATSTHDCVVFTLALLLSSLFIYNSVGAIDDTALKTLSLVTNISKLVRISADHEPTADELAGIFPSFCWVLRDFTLKLETPQGHAITADEYLERALVTVTGEPDPVKQVLKDCFRERACVTLPRPCQEERDLQSLGSADVDGVLRPVFVEQARAAGHVFRSRAKPKTFLGQKVSGSMLITMANEFVQKINDGAVPVMKDSWQMIAETQTKDVIDGLIDAFGSRARDLRIQGPPLAHEQCQELVKKMTQSCLTRFAEQALLKDHPGFRELITNRLERLGVDTVQENDVALGKYLDGKGQRLREEALGAEDWHALSVVMKAADTALATAVQPTTSVLGAWAQIKNAVLWPCLHELAAKVEARLESCRIQREEERATIAGLRDQNANLEKRRLETEQNLREAERRSQEELQAAFQETKRQKTALSAEVASMRGRADSLNERLLSTVTDYQRQILDIETAKQGLDSALADALARLERAEQETRKLKDVVADLQAQVSKEEGLRHGLKTAESNVAYYKEQLASCEERLRTQETRFQAFVSEITEETNKLRTGFSTEKMQWTLSRSEMEEAHAKQMCAAAKTQQTLQANLSMAEIEVQHCRAKYEDLDVECGRLRDEVSKTLAALEQERATLATCRQEQDEQMVLHGQETINLQNQLLEEHSKSCARIGEIESRLSNSDIALQACKRKLAEADEEVSKARECRFEIQKTNADLQALRTHNEWLKSERDAANTRLEELRSRNGSLERKLFECQKEHEMEMLRIKIQPRSQLE